MGAAVSDDDSLGHPQGRDKNVFGETAITLVAQHQGVRAQVRSSAFAFATGPAGIGRTHPHLLPGLVVRYLGAHVFNHASNFMTQNARRKDALAFESFGDPEVRSTDGVAEYLYQHITRSQRRRHRCGGGDFSGCGVDDSFHRELLLSFHARGATQQHVCCGFIGNETADKTTGGGSADNAHFVSTVCHSQRVGECSDVFDV